ncbi:MAG: O-antigen ligase family protein [Bacteroidota bacterium]|nr:O-antigen ligase family protein [Bacteroidota bacterium]
MFILFVSIGFYLEIDNLYLLPIPLIALYLCIYHTVFYTLILCFLIPFSIFIDDIGSGFGISIPTEPMIWLLFTFYILKLFIKGQIDWQKLKMPLVFFLVINLIWMLFSVIASSMPLVSFKYYIARLWFVFIFYFFLLDIFKNPNIIRKFLSYMLFGTFLLVLITLFKHSKESFTRGWGYDIMKPFFEEHTMYSAYVSFFVPIALMFATRGGYFKFNFSYRLFFLLVFITLILGIIFSFTRASWISLLAAAVFYIFIQFKISFNQILSILFLAALIGFSKQDQILYSLEKNKQGSADDIEAHAQSVSNITTDPSNLERVNRWHCAFLMFKERPIFGFGPGTYTFQYAPFQRPENLTLISTNSGDLGNTHSEYFNALSETGLVGFISWVGLFLSSIWLGLSIIYKTNNPLWVKSLAKAVLLGLFTYYIHAFLNNFSDFDKIAAPFWGFLAILTALKFYHSNDEVIIEKSLD